MIRTFITPTKTNCNVAFEFPEDYLGQELELIVFKKQEGLIDHKHNTGINSISLELTDAQKKLIDEEINQININPNYLEKWSAAKEKLPKP